MFEGEGNNMIGVYDGKIAGLYDLEQTLGRGHYAVVKLAKHVFTGEKVAVKVIDKAKLDQLSRDHLFQEVRCMKLVQHPNIVRLYEVIDTQTKLYLILELADGGDMYDYIMKHEKGLCEDSARKYFRQIVHAISYCHKLHVVHRDLKPENVVFFEKLGMVKLTDFGFSNKFFPGQKLETSCGSLAYSAPEILLGDSYDAPAVDIWSLGVILYMLVVGKAPFQEANDSETLTKIMDCKYTIPDHVSHPCQSLIAQMLIRDPNKRSNLEEIACNPWLNEGAELDVTKVLPLVSRQHLTEEDHALIIHKMVTGNIASVDDILDALDKNEYNHITATYFLLAERKLRAYRLHQADLVRKDAAAALKAKRESHQEAELIPRQDPKPSTRSFDETSLLLNPGTDQVTKEGSLGFIAPNKLTEDRPGGGRLRSFSIVEEEEEEEDEFDEIEDEEIIKLPDEDTKEEEHKEKGQHSRSGSRSGSRRGSRTSSCSSLKEKCLRDMKLDLSLLHRLECVRRGSSSLQGSVQSSTTVSPSTEESQMPEPPFPPSSNIGIGRTNRTKSAGTSPVTTPPSSVPNSGPGIVINGALSVPSGVPQNPLRVTPQSSVSSSPNSQESSPSSTVPSSPKNQSSTFNYKFKTLPSPNRRLHSVRSSPQLILNEIFEEVESDSEVLGTESAHDVTRRESATEFSHIVASPTVIKKHKLIRSRTASCSSSDVSDDDQEAKRKKHRTFGRQLTEGTPKKVEDSRVPSLHTFVASEASELTINIEQVYEDANAKTSSPLEEDAYGYSACNLNKVLRPLSATCDPDHAESARGAESCSTDNMLNIDTTLRESRSLNCILNSSKEGDPDGDFAEVKPVTNMTVSSDNVTTIYIQDSKLVSSEPKCNDSLMIVRTNDDIKDDTSSMFMKLSVSKGLSPHIVKASDVVLGLVDSSAPCSFDFNSHLAKVRPIVTSERDVPHAFSFNRPISEPPVLSKCHETSFSKSVSHIESLSSDHCGKLHLRTSATNGSLATGRNSFLTDINQNTGNRKNKSEKGTSPMAFHGTSKCCSLS